jgi:hypothetical protein
MIQMKIGGPSIDLQVDTGMTHLVATQTMGPLSQRHATIVRAVRDQAHSPFLISRKYNLKKKHEIRHEFLYLPDCPLALMGRDLCKRRAQITFDSDGPATLKLRGSEAMILTLMVVQEEEWQLYAFKKGIPEMPEFP